MTIETVMGETITETIMTTEDKITKKTAETGIGKIIDTKIETKDTDIHRITITITIMVMIIEMLIITQIY